MATLHDAAKRAEIVRRLAALRRDSTRRRGKMSVDQRLWHVNEALEDALGKRPAPPQKPPLPKAIVKFIVINLPWPKGEPTLPTLIASGDYDFEAERTRCLRLIEDLAARGIEADWPRHPVFGR